MSLMATDTGSGFEATPLGMQQGVCVFVNDIGLQEGEYQGKKILRHQCIISWELSEKMEDGRPFMVSTWYTLSLNEKANLRHDLESWRGKPFTADELKGFDLEKLIGVNCYLNLVANANGKAKVASVNPLPKAMPKINRYHLEMSDKFKFFIETMRAKAQVPEVEKPEDDKQQAHENNDLPF